MKSPSHFSRFHPKFRLLLSLLAVLLTGCVLLAGFGAISKSFAARAGSPPTALSFSSAGSAKTVIASNHGPAPRLDQQGNRSGGMSFLPLHQRSTRAIGP